MLTKTEDRFGRARAMSEKDANRAFSPGAPFLTEIINSHGSQETICSWLKSVTCVQVTCESQTNPPIETYRVRKICEIPTVPALLPIHFEAGTPPARRFELRGPSSASLQRLGQ